MPISKEFHCGIAGAASYAYKEETMETYGKN
jgi:hypothetical protein